MPKATHVVEFKRQGVPTSLKVPVDMVGKKAAELSTTSYGGAKASLLLEPAPAPPPATASWALAGPSFLAHVRNWLAGRLVS